MRLSRLLHVLLLVATVFAQPVFAAPMSAEELAALQAKARRGNAIAQYNLGLAYSEGRGVAADPLEAYVWLSLAMENGTRGRALDNLLATLSNEQLAEGRQLLATRRAAFGLKEPAAAPTTAPSAAPTTAATPAPAAPTGGMPAGPGGPVIVAPPAPAPTNPTSSTSSLQADKQQLSVELSNAWAEIERLKGALAQARAAGTDAENYRKERDALSVKITGLTGDLATLRDESDQLHRLIAQTEKDAGAARTGSQASEEKAKAAEAKIGELATETAHLKAELDHARESLAALQAARPAAPTYPDLTGRVAELEALLAAAQQKQSAGDAMTEAKAKEVQTLQQDLAQAKAALVAAQQAAPAYPDLRPKVQELEAALAAKPSAPAYPDLHERVAQLDTELGAVRQKAGETETAAATQTARAAQLTAELARANADLETARKTIAEKPAAPTYPDLREHAAQLEQQLAAAQAQEKTAVEKAGAATAQVAALETAATKAAEERAALEQKLASATARPAAPAYPDLTGRVTELQALLAAAQQKQSAGDAMTEMKAKEVQTLQQDLAQAKATLVAAQQAAPAYPDLRPKVQELEAALAAKPTAPAYPDLRENAGQLEQQLAATQAQIKSVTAQAKTAETRATSLEAAVAAAGEEQSALKQQLSAAQAQAQAAMEKAAAAAAQVAALETAATKAAEEHAALEKQLAAASARPAAPAYPDLSGRVTELETQLAGAQRKLSAGDAITQAKAKEVQTLQQDLAQAKAALVAAQQAAPAYPDLRPKVQELEAALAAKPATPAYPDLRERVAQLETELGTVRQKAGEAEATTASQTARATQLAEELGQLKQAQAVAQKEATEKAAAATAQVAALETAATKAAEERAALEKQLAAASARPAAPAYPDLSGRVAELEALLAAAQQKQSAGDAMTEAKAKEVQTLQQDLAQAKAALVAARQAAPAYPDLRPKVQELEAALAAKPSTPAYPDLRERVAQLDTELGAVRQKAGESETAAAAQATRAAQLAAELEAAKKAAPAYPDLREHAGQLEQQLAAAQAQAQSAAVQAKAAESRVAALETAAAKAGEEQATLQQKLAAAPAYPDLRPKVQELEAALAAKPATPAYPDLREHAAQLEQQLATAQAQGQSAAEKAAAAASRVATLETAATQAAAERATLEKQLAAATARPTAPAYPDLSGRVTELQAQLAAAQQAATAPTAALTAAQAEKQQLGTELAGAKQEAERLKAQLQAGGTETDKLRRERDALSTRISELAGDIASLRTEREGLQTAVGQGQQALAAAQTQVKAAVERTHFAEAQIAALEAAATKATEEHINLARKLAAASSGQTVTPAYPDLSGRVTELEAQLAAMEKKLAAEIAQSEAQAKAGQNISDQLLQAKEALAAAQNAPSAYPDLRPKVQELEAALAARPATAAPAYPDLRPKVQELEAALAAKPAAPAYPDLSNRVQELETALAAAKAAPAQPAYPDLRERVAQLDKELDTVRQKAGAAETATTAQTTRAAQLADELGQLKQTQAIAQKEAADKAGAAAAQVAALEAAATRAAEERAAIEKQLAAATARPATPAYPDLSGRVTELEAALAARPANAVPAYPDLRPKVQELEAALAAKPAAPAYPDLSNRVQELEASLAAAKAAPAQPAYPDLRARTAELEQKLAAVSSAPPTAPAYPDLRERVAQLETELGAIREKAGAAESSATTQTARATQLAAELARANAELESARKAVAEKPAGPAQPDQTARVTELEAQLAAAAQAKAGTESELQALRTQLTAATGENERARQEADRLTKAAADSRQQGEQLLAANRDLQAKLDSAAKPAEPAYPDLRERVGELEAQAQALRQAPPAYPDLRHRVQELEASLAAAKAAPVVPAAATARSSAAPEYPDLRPKVDELEKQVAALKAVPAAPAWPDQRARVSELETQLAAVQEAALKLSAGSLSAPEAGALKTELADTKERLATTLRGYSLIEKERDDLAAKAAQSATTLAANQDALTRKLSEAEIRANAATAEAARLKESLGALQRSTGDTNRELASLRALLTQQQGANAVLGQDNIRLKIALAHDPAAQQTVTALPALPGLRTHIVAAGDSLSKISQRYYGTPERWPDIYQVNRDVIGAHGELRVGTELRIP